MHFSLSWSVLVCLSVGSGRPLGPIIGPFSGSQVKSIFWRPKMPFPTPPRREPCDFSCDASDSFLRFSEEEGVPTAVWMETGTFARENPGDLRLRYLVLFSQIQFSLILSGPDPFGAPTPGFCLPNIRPRKPNTLMCLNLPTKATS